MCNALCEMGPPVGDGNTHSLLPFFFFVASERLSHLPTMARGAVAFRFQRHLNDLAVDAPDLPLNPKVSFF